MKARDGRSHAVHREQALCETSFFVEGVDETTRAAYVRVDCLPCLRLASAAAEQRASVLRELVARAEASPVPWCRAYDAPCINPGYCDARDACCAGDPDCRPEEP